MLDGSPKQFSSDHKVFEFHGFKWIVRTVLIGDENHRNRHALIADNSRVVTGSAGKALDRNSALGRRGRQLVA